VIAIKGRKMNETKRKAYMKSKIFWPVSLVFLLGLFLFSGCAGYGSARYLGRTESPEKLTSLVADFDSYHVYYSGMSLAFPSGLIFDPKDDSLRVEQGRWIRIENRDKLETVVSNLQRYHRYPPRLYTLTGEDGRQYGYIYTSYLHIVVRQVEDDAVHVLEMFEAPHLKYDNNGFFQRPAR